MLPAEKQALRFPDLRHTCASSLIALNAHPKEICDWLGHGSISITMGTYGHLYPDSERALADRLGEVQRTARPTSEPAVALLSRL